MTDDVPGAGAPTPGDRPAESPSERDDWTRPHPARIYAHWLGDKDAYGPDRQVAETIAGIAPWVVEGARANRAFLQRAVSFLASHGIQQFLDIGAGLPTAGNVHEIAQRRAADARVVYVDHDPVVVRHAQALLATDERTIAVQEDARDPSALLANPAVQAHLDFGCPIAVLFVAVLHFITDDEKPARIVAAIRDALPEGSYVVISHVADVTTVRGQTGRADATQEAAKAYRELAAPFVLRTREEISDLFDGFDLLEPGVVPAHRWRPAGRRGPAVPVLAGVGRLTARRSSERSRVQMGDL